MTENKTELKTELKTAEQQCADGKPVEKTTLTDDLKAPAPAPMEMRTQPTKFIAKYMFDEWRIFTKLHTGEYNTSPPLSGGNCSAIFHDDGKTVTIKKGGCDDKVTEYQVLESQKMIGKLTVAQAKKFLSDTKKIIPDFQQVDDPQDPDNLTKTKIMIPGWGYSTEPSILGGSKEDLGYFGCGQEKNMPTPPGYINLVSEVSEHFRKTRKVVPKWYREKYPYQYWIMEHYVERECNSDNNIFNYNPCTF